jgi:membrane protein implicated in regulation of membrane protease activity
MNPMVKYGLGRLGLFVVCAALAVVLLPSSLNLMLRILIGFVVSAGLSFVLLRRWRDEVANRLLESSQRRTAQKDRLRTALAGDDEAPAKGPQPPGS